MTVKIDLDTLMKQVAKSTIDSLTIPTMEFDTPYKAAEYYHDHLDETLSEFEQCFKTDLQAQLAKHIADA